MVTLRAAALALVVACASGGVPIGEPFRLRPGQSAKVEDLRIEFVAIASDSRCPPDVTCVWEGDAVVRLDVNGQTVELHTHQPKPASVLGYTIELRSLSREPYVAEFVVRR
jgi:hypothetical protein